MVVDFADKDEVDEATLLWENQIKHLSDWFCIVKSYFMTHICPMNKI
jgi:hypothetical protein